ncbi:hypothetical protein Bbelb_028750 [Branchiostoma belcheri]|nr:hypothetical protein Bbelb_028750 [Branchiostoma belcheri]
MGSPVSPIVANLYMEKFELKAINSFPGTPPANWFRYVDDTWCRLKKGLADSFFEHINKVDKHISFTQETSQDNTLPFLDAKLHVETDGHIEVEVYRKPTHTDQYLIFDSHHPLEQKLGVIRTLFHRADTLITLAEARAKEHTHLKKALSKCGYQQWTFNKALKPSDSSKKTSRNSQLDRTKTVNISIPYIQGVSEKIRRILHNYNIATNFKPCRTLRQMLFHPKDKLKNCVKSDVIYRLKCEDHQCKETYIGETSQPLKERYKQHCRASNSGFSSAIWHHLDKHKGHSFHLESTDILDREARWFERGVKEAIYERLYKPSLNRKGGLRVELSMGSRRFRLAGWVRYNDDGADACNKYQYATLGVQQGDSTNAQYLLDLSAENSIYSIPLTVSCDDAKFIDLLPSLQLMSQDEIVDMSEGAAVVDFRLDVTVVLNNVDGFSQIPKDEDGSHFEFQLYVSANKEITTDDTLIPYVPSEDAQNQLREEMMFSGTLHLGSDDLVFDVDVIRRYCHNTDPAFFAAIVDTRSEGAYDGKIGQVGERDETNNIQAVVVNFRNCPAAAMDVAIDDFSVTKFSSVELGEDMDLMLKVS